MMRSSKKVAWGGTWNSAGQWIINMSGSSTNALIYQAQLVRLNRRVSHSVFEPLLTLARGARSLVCMHTLESGEH